MGSRSVPKGRPIKGAPRIRGLCFEAGDDGVLHIDTDDYHDPGVLSVEDQIRLAHWLLTRNEAAQAPALSPVDKAKNAWSDWDSQDVQDELGAMQSQKASAAESDNEI